MHQPVGPPELDLCRDTVETQARTIRHLLANYEALLRKVEQDSSGGPALAVDWQLGTAQAFATGAAIPMGWWYPSAQVTLVFGVNYVTFEAQKALFSDGTPTAERAFSLAPLTARIVPAPTPASAPASASAPAPAHAGAV